MMHWQSSTWDRHSPLTPTEPALKNPTPIPILDSQAYLESVPSAAPGTAAAPEATEAVVA